MPCHQFGKAENFWMIGLNQLGEIPDRLKLKPSRAQKLKAAMAPPEKLRLPAGFIPLYPTSLKNIKLSFVFQ